MEKVVKVFDAFMNTINNSEKVKDKLKIVKIPEAQWQNHWTRRKEKITNLYFLGDETSNKAFLINKITFSLLQSPNGITESKEREYTLRQRVYHVNVYPDNKPYKHKEKEGFIHKGRLLIKIYGQEFCNPVNRYHILTNPDIALILKGQLSSENGGSAYSYDYKNVSISQEDKAITDDNDSLIRARVSPIQLLTRRKTVDKSTLKYFRQELIPQENEVYVKYKYTDRYILEEKDEVDESKLSDYYKVLTREDILKAHNSIPEEKFDVGCFGLGSGGTSILEQLGRSTLFRTYLLLDKDVVESKNLRNQWYTRGDLVCSKARRSASILHSLSSVNIIEVENHNIDFLHMDLTPYRFKYCLSMFDSIDIRINLLERIKEGKIRTKYLIDTRYLDLECSIYFIDCENKDELEYYEKMLRADGEALNKELISEESTCIKHNIIDIYKYASTLVFCAIKQIEDEDINKKSFVHIEATTDKMPNYIIIKKD